jgi:hypothetical protein
MRIKIEVFGDAVFVTDLTGFIFGVNPFQVMVASPTMLFLHQDDGFSTRDLMLNLTEAGGITGSDQHVTPGMPSGKVTFDLAREP